VKHAVIFAHPNLESFTASVAGAYVKTAEALGHAAVTRDLYRMNFASNLQSSELPWDKHFCAGDDVQDERAILRDIDVFAFIYPFWLNSPPAIIKGYARLTHAFSKKMENHIAAFALHTMYHNFVKISGAHRMTPAQAAGVDSRLWEIGDIVKVVEEWEATASSPI
jgi:hypothetical protein